MQPAYAQSYEQLYHHHWWWRAREAIVLRELGRLTVPRPARVMDVGCGNGLILNRLAAWGDVHGIELDRSVLTDGAPHREHIYCEPLGDERYRAMSGTFDLVTALDVIEHVEDDGLLVRQMLQLLKPWGHLLVTVPAFSCLWSNHDEANVHYRRYGRSALRKVLDEHGTLLRVRHLFPSLFLFKWLVVQVDRRRVRQIDQARLPSALTCTVMQRWLGMEERLARPLNLPFGSSLLAVVRKSPSA